MLYVLEKPEIYQEDEISHELHGGGEQGATGKTEGNPVFVKDFLTGASEPAVRGALTVRGEDIC